MGESTGNACGPTIAARRGAPRESARLGRDRRRGAGGTAPVFEVGPSDPVAHTRACEPLPASAFPEVPAGYRPSHRSALRRVLRLLPADLKAEAHFALREIAANAATLHEDLGEFAPDPERAARILRRLGESEATLAALDLLAQYHREVRDIAMSDTVEILEEAHKEYRHRLGRVAGLADRYTALPRFFEGRSAAIARGIQRARTEKEARRRAEAARAAKPRPNEGESGG